VLNSAILFSVTITYAKGASVTAVEKEAEMMQSEIRKEIRALFKANMKIFNWDIPENDDRKAAEIILSIMRDALDELGEEVASGKYDHY
jgi:nitrous oxide reductase accessory protein NosL